MRKNKLLIAIFIFTFITSCNIRNKSVNSSDYIGKKVIFPENLIFTNYLNDTIVSDISASVHKILISVDSAGCTGCKMQLDRWKEFIIYIDSITERKVSFLFFIQPKDVEEFSYILINEDFIHPICIDIDGEFNKINELNSDNVFLLNKENCILETGNPIQNPDIEKTYIERITGSIKVVK